MSNSLSLQAFSFQEMPVRTTIDENGAIWFVVADACKVLGITNVTHVIDRLDADGVRLAEVIDSLGRKQNATIANEPNLYRLIFRSDKPIAKAFQDWVYNEVLPSIRKTGGYSVPTQQPTQPLALPKPVFRDPFLEPARCQAPSKQQLETHILDMVQKLQPFFPRGVTVLTMMRYSPEIQAYRLAYESGPLLKITESLVARGLLTRTPETDVDGAYYYRAPQVQGYLN